MPEGIRTAVDRPQVEQQITELAVELENLHDRLDRTREYLLQAAYAHDRDWPCPRCGRPMDGYSEGAHACLAIERENEVNLTRELLNLQVELAELRTIKAELAAGMAYASQPAPIQGILLNLRPPLSASELQQHKMRARRALLMTRRNVHETTAV